GYIRTLEESLKEGTLSDAPAPPELGLSQTHGRLDGAALLREIESLRQENLLMSTEIPSPFAWYRGAQGSAVPGPMLTRAATLLSNDATAVREELARDLDPRLVPCVLPLLANEELAQQAVGALRAIADRITGQLTDALLDAGAPFVVRRRVARVMSSCST